MDAALIALAACLLTSFGGRAHLTISMLSGSLGRSPGLLVVSAATALLATLIAAALGAAVSGQFVGEARQMIVVGALLLAAIELAVPVTLAHPREPTRSLGAIALVLFARQLIDAPRLCIFASAAALANMDHAVLGGGIGAVLAATMVWIFSGREFDAKTLYSARITLAVILLLAGLFIGSITQ
ncbi:MAG: hypothetical protein R3235_04440 [Altererythrobacter ishigakiensis]|nr:hypothetical protein [Altererythrobacter ishigakiensis]